MILWLLVSCSSPLFTKGLAPIEGVSRGPGTSVEARSCETCHEDQHEQWSGSRHALAFTNQVFQVALAQSSPQQWCIDCHGPRAEAREAGIDCAVCHVRDGAILVPSNHSDGADEFHPVRVEPTMSDSRFCAGCHQFETPSLSSKGGFYSKHPMQNTYEEWRASPAGEAGEQCQGCHMGKAGHRFPGAHAIDFVRSAVEIDVSRVDGVMTATLNSKSVGHDLPTGDPFRRLELRLCTDPELERVRHRLVLWREFDEDFVPASDTTLEAGVPQVWTVEVDDEPLWWRLDYFYGDAEHEPLLTAGDVSFRLAEGRVP